jgi:response regulator RpfG family c-di-GMP phosphodiesterase
MKTKSPYAILFVDDELLILLSMSAQVRRNFGEKFQYFTAQSAREALELIDEVIADEIRILIIFSDWSMPGMNGDEFLKQVHSKYPEIEKVIITGYADQSAIDQLHSEINLSHFMRKPWDERELVGTIQNVVDRIS